MLEAIGPWRVSRAVGSLAIFLVSVLWLSGRAAAQPQASDSLLDGMVFRGHRDTPELRRELEEFLQDER